MARVRYGFHWFYLGDDLRLKIDHPVYETLAIRVLYTLGGYDSLRGDRDVRGYYLSVIPVKGAADGYRSGPSDGVKILLKDVKRRTDKSDALALSKGIGIMPLEVANVCSKLGAKYKWSDMVVRGGC